MAVHLDTSIILSYFELSLQDPITRKIHDLDSKTLKQLLPEIPLWVKRPDYERVSADPHVRIPLFFQFMWPC